MKLRYAFVASLLALGLAACNKVDNEDMANKIKSMINDKLGSASTVKVKSVDCPSGQSIKEGTKFDCTITLADGTKMPAHVAMQADQKFGVDLDPDDLEKLAAPAPAE